MFKIAETLAKRVCRAISETLDEGGDLKTVKKAARQAAAVGRYTLLGPSSLNKLELPFFEISANERNYWTQRLVGEIRATISGLGSQASLKAAFTSLIAEGPSPYLKGPDGYRRVAEMFCRGSMKKAYLLMSAVCKADGLPFEKLEWGLRFEGTTKEFNATPANRTA